MYLLSALTTFGTRYQKMELSKFLSPALRFLLPLYLITDLLSLHSALLRLAHPQVLVALLQLVTQILPQAELQSLKLPRLAVHQPQ